MPHPEGEQHASLVSRLRLAALIPLGAVAMFLVLEAHFAPADLTGSLLMVYGFSAALAAGALLATYTDTGMRNADRLAFLVAVGLAVNTSLYLYVSPRFPAMVAFALSALMMGCALLFTWDVGWMLGLCAISLASFAMAASLVPHDRVVGPPFPFAFGGLAVGAAVALASARTLGRMRQSLTRREEELASLSSRLMSVEEEDRRRLSHELHEGLAQSLSAAIAHLWLVEQQLGENANGLRARAADARHLIGQTLSQMRDLSQVLRPSTLDDYGLVPSLDTYVRTFGAREDIAAIFRTDALPERLAPEVETAVYRIAQEALTNVARHARAKQVCVKLMAAEGHLELEVTDDGVGFPREAHGRHGSGVGIGLIGIRERVRGLGGTVMLSSERGARLRVRLPLPR